MPAQKDEIWQIRVSLCGVAPARNITLNLIMKKLLNTLYVTTQGAYISKEGQTLNVKIEGETKMRLPVHNLESIVCFGNVLCSPFALGHCAEHNVLVSFLTRNGRFLARVSGPAHGNVLLRRTQYRFADDEGMSAEIAAALVLGKITNCRTSLNRSIRDRPDVSTAPQMREASRRLARCAKQLTKQNQVSNVRGTEGEAAKLYFSVFNGLITNANTEFVFDGRNRRPPRDPVNALLSFAYVLLEHDVKSAIEAVGLDPAVGFLHRDRPGRAGLALDLMEELRPMLADRIVLSLLNREQLKPGDFTTDAGGAVRMSDDARRIFLKTWQERKQDKIMHPFLQETVEVGLLPHTQALLLARYLRGDLDAYPPFAWK